VKSVAEVWNNHSTLINFLGDLMESGEVIKTEELKVRVVEHRSV